jgi:myosin heavy subunit
MIFSVSVCKMQSCRLLGARKVFYAVVDRNLHWRVSDKKYIRWLPGQTCEAIVKHETKDHYKLVMKEKRLSVFMTASHAYVILRLNEARPEFVRKPTIRYDFERKIIKRLPVLQITAGLALAAFGGYQLMNLKKKFAEEREESTKQLEEESITKLEDTKKQEEYIKKLKEELAKIEEESTKQLEEESKKKIEEEAAKIIKKEARQEAIEKYLKESEEAKEESIKQLRERTRQLEESWKREEESWKKEEEEAKKQSAKRAREALEKAKEALEKAEEAREKAEEAREKAEEAREEARKQARKETEEARKKARKEAEEAEEARKKASAEEEALGLDLWRIVYAIKQGDHVIVIFFGVANKLFSSGDDLDTRVINLLGDCHRTRRIDNFATWVRG